MKDLCLPSDSQEDSFPLGVRALALARVEGGGGEEKRFLVIITIGTLLPCKGPLYGCRNHCLE